MFRDFGDRDVFSYIEDMYTLQSMMTITVCVKFLRNIPKNM